MEKKKKRMKQRIRTRERREAHFICEESEAHNKSPGQACLRGKTIRMCLAVQFQGYRPSWQVRYGGRRRRCMVIPPQSKKIE